MMYPRCTHTANTRSAVICIRCWVCRSDTDETCADPFNNYTSPIINCDEIRLPYGRSEATTATNACRVGRYKTAASLADPDGKWVYVRDCAYLNEPCDGVGDEYHCELKDREDGAFIEYTTCNDFDGCNGAVSVAATASSLFIIAITLPILLSMFY